MSSDPSPSTRGKKGGLFGKKGFQILGLGLQDVIKYFFQGNASLAIVVLILICFFLAIEAIWFFPNYRHELQNYRKAGQEFVDLIGKEIDAHTRIVSSANIAYFAEVNESSKEEDALIGACRQVSTNVENRTERARESLKDALKAAENLPEGAPEQAVAEARVSRLRSELDEKISAALKDEAVWEFENLNVHLDAKQKEKIAEAVRADIPGAEKEDPYIAGLREASAAKKKAAAEKHAEFKAVIAELRDAAQPLKSLHSKLRAIGAENRRVLDKFSSAPARRKALLEGAAATKDPEEKARKLAQVEKIVMVKPDYAALNQPFYDSVPEYIALSAKMESDVSIALTKLPENPNMKAARENLKIARSAFRDMEERAAINEKAVPNWRHDRQISFAHAVMAFTFGRDWVTNSSWNDFFGLLPLFTGSFLISVIALVVSVPFSVCAAIYVNQLANSKEEHFIKPAIEFIGAIPSVVLGFFGILVLGTTLREVSQIEWLSWVPGFPMAERLNILNAGLLLAFMAVPTIFTLTEDALNNVPQAFTEASLALGSSKLQTVFRVVVPTALSGIIAAILLGFGRIIGETMVVLLVAGNKIQIPDFTAGLGVITQPVHTMTGIIAQELGEVDKGSLHWRALFMVGMVLFFISLAVNYSAQKILRKFQKV